LQIVTTLTEGTCPLLGVEKLQQSWPKIKPTTANFSSQSDASGFWAKSLTPGFCLMNHFHKMISSVKIDCCGET